jgi:hypothetical protein
MATLAGTTKVCESDSPFERGRVSGDRGQTAGKPREMGRLGLREFFVNQGF